jgi:hypothetical protein
MSEQWSNIMQEVDRLYHANTTSEGRVSCIADYIVGLLDEQALRCERVHTTSDVDARSGPASPDVAVSP